MGKRWKIITVASVGILLAQPVAGQDGRSFKPFNATGGVSPFVQTPPSGSSGPKPFGSSGMAPFEQPRPRPSELGSDLGGREPEKKCSPEEMSNAMAVEEQVNKKAREQRKECQGKQGYSLKEKKVFDPCLGYPYKHALCEPN